MVDLVVELAARVQRGQDHLQGRLALKFGMGVNGNAAAVIGDGDGAVCAQGNVNAAGLARHRLVHGVIQYFRRQMMEGVFVGAAHVHAGAAPHRL